MKNTLLSLASAAVALGSTVPAVAQYAPPPPTQPFPGFLNDYLRKQDPYYANWDIGGTFRMRYELKENGLGLPPVNDFRKTGVDNDNSYFSSKLLLKLAYTDRWWNFLIEGRNSSTTGDDRATIGGTSGNFESDGPLDIHQAYVFLGNHKEFPVSLKVGRQELSYGDERLVGAFAWHNIGRVFDAAKVRWQNSLFAAEAFGSKIVLPDDNNLNGWNDYNYFSGLVVSTKRIPKNLTELYFFSRNDERGSTASESGAFAPFQYAAPFARDIYTLGARFRSATNELGKWDYTVEGFYQFGNWKPTAASIRQDHQAYAFVANLGYTFADTYGTPRVALEYAFGSGDSDPNDNKHETFDNLYPTNHKFYGYMDYFSWQNLHDVRAIYQMKPHPQISFAVEGHLFWLADTADNLYNVGGVARGAGPSAVGFGRNPGYDNFVGSEIDVVVGYAATKYASLEAGYGHFFKGSYLNSTWQNSGGAADGDWFYLQTVIKF